MNKSHILLFSKDNSQSVQIKNILQTQDYIVHCVNNTLVAQQVIKDNAIELIILDTRESHEHEDVLIGETLRQYTSKVPIVFLAFNIDKSFSDATAFAKPFSYVAKPFNDVELLTQAQLCIAQYNVAIEQLAQQKIFKQINNFSMQVTQLTTDEIFSHSNEFLKNELQIRLCFFYIYNEDLHNFTVTTFNDATNDKQYSIVTAAKTYMFECINDNQTYQYVTNNEELSDKFFEKNLINSEEALFAAPLIHGDRILGGYVLIGDNSQFQSHNINLLQLITLRLASIMNNAITFEELNDTKQKFKDLIESSPQTITEIDIAGNILYVNKKGHELFGKRNGTMPYDNICDYASSEQIRIKIIEEIKKVIREKSSGPTEFLVHNGYGKEYFINVYSNLVEENGLASKIRNIMIDVTEEKKANDKVHKLSLVVEQNPNSIIITDRDGLIEYVNPKYAEINNLDINSCIGHLPNVLKKEFHSQEGYDEIWQTIRNGKQWTGEFLNTLAPNKQLWEYVNISPLTSRNVYDQEEISNFIITKEDITQRKYDEDKVFQEKEKLQIMLDSITDGVIAIDSNGLIIMANTMTEEILGFEPGFLTNKHMSSVYNLWDEPLISQVINRISWIIEEKTPFTTEEPISIKTNTGIIKMVDFHGAPFFDKSSNVMGVIVICSDVTDKIRLQDEVFKSKKLESVGLLAGGIAHDFNNILTSILGNITLAKIYSNPQDKPYEILLEAEKACLKSRDLTGQLLTFSRGGNPIKKLSKIDKLVEESAKFIMRGSNFKVDFHISPDIYSVEMDEGQINQVINNLLINSKQAMNDKGSINISVYNIDDISDLPNASKLKNDTNYVKIDISDSGCGISQENIEKIFDPYFTTKQAGNGLGLAICYSIIKKHNGIIYAQSEVGHGATFSILLPAKKIKLQDEATKVTRSSNKVLSILIMDDEEPVRNITMKLLSMLGHKVDCACDGAQAIQMYKEAWNKNKKYDVVFMDMVVPGGIGGEEAVKILHDFDPDAKAIISSGFSTGEVMSNYKEYGFCGVLTKPFKIEEVQQILNEI